MQVVKIIEPPIMFWKLTILCKMIHRYIKLEKGGKSVLYWMDQTVKKNDVARMSTLFIRLNDMNQNLNPDVTDRKKNTLVLCFVKD